MMTPERKMVEKRGYEQCQESVGVMFDIKRVKTEPIELISGDYAECSYRGPPLSKSMFGLDKVKQENFSRKGDIWSNLQTSHLNYHHIDYCYGYGNIYPSENHYQPFYRGNSNMADVISFDSQDFLLQSDIDLLQSVEFEFPSQEVDDIKPEVTQIEIITSPTKRKRGTGSRKSQASGGTGTKKSSPSQYTTVPLPPCKVCSGVATGFHFGVITCEACKVGQQLCFYLLLICLFAFKTN